MGNKVETGATNQRPDDLREDGQCPKCGTHVAKTEEDHDCTDSDD